MLRSTFLTPCFILILLAGSSVSAQDGSPQEAYRKARTLLAEGESLGDAKKLEQARALFMSATADEKLAGLAYYHAGYAGTKQFPLVKSRTGRKVLLDKTRQALEKARELDPGFAETPALLASCYGMAINLDPNQMMVLGPKIGQLQAEASQKAPKNPRVTLLGAISLYYTPAQFGGDKAKATAQFQEAAKQFSSFKAPSEQHPDWGKAEVHAWIGRAHVDAGRLPECRKALEKALSVDKNYAWVKSALMPELAAAEKK